MRSIVVGKAGLFLWFVALEFKAAIGPLCSFLIITILLGIGGAFLGFLGTQLGFGDLSGFDLRSIGMAFGRAVLLLFAYSLLMECGRVT